MQDVFPCVISNGDIHYIKVRKKWSAVCDILAKKYLAPSGRLNHITDSRGEHRPHK